MIPLFSAAAVHEGLGLDAALGRVLARQWFVLGEEVAQFEREFAAWCGAAHCVAVANGTDALELSLRALEVPAGGEVLCTANAGFYASAAAFAIGAVPRYVEIDDETLTMSVSALRAALAARKPAAVIATHLYGRLADVAGIAAACREAGVPWIEDCAQAHGAALAGPPAAPAPGATARRAGSFGDLACFSFYPTKNLGALGDGGAVTTSREDLAASVQSLRQYGWSGKYTVARLGGRNSRLDELQAAVLRDKLQRVDAHNARRRAIARRYDAGLAGLALRRPLPAGDEHAMHLYVVRSSRRAELREHLRERGVATEVHYPVPDHRQPAMAGRFESVSLPVTEAACASVLSLPLYPGLDDAQVDAVVAAVRAFHEGPRP